MLIKICLLFILSSRDLLGDEVRIGCYNIKSFGQTKAKNDSLMGNISKIIRLYDLIAILEVRDKSMNSVNKLKKILNSNDQGIFYNYKINPRQGSSTYKEQIAVFYKNSSNFKIVPVDVNIPEIAFERSPFILNFTMIHIDPIFIVVHHAKPKDAQNELIKLHLLTQKIQEKYKTNRILIVGDLNADGAYLSEKKFKESKFYQSFNWTYLDSRVPSMVLTSNTYDRVFMQIGTLQNVHDIRVFNITKELGFSKKLTLSISDHYPIECKINNNFVDYPDEYRRNQMIYLKAMLDEIYRNIISIIYEVQKFYENEVLIYFIPDQIPQKKRKTKD